MKFIKRHQLPLLWSIIGFIYIGAEAGIMTALGVSMMAGAIHFSMQNYVAALFQKENDNRKGEIDNVDTDQKGG